MKAIGPNIKYWKENIKRFFWKISKIVNVFCISLGTTIINNKGYKQLKPKPKNAQSDS